MNGASGNVRVGGWVGSAERFARFARPDLTRNHLTTQPLMCLNFLSFKPTVKNSNFYFQIFE
uniref:Uncharacterized protein n=1 Tax=Rhizophora mucronata TaxID=61149 RepID=A0A2P2PQS8_RHIMU